MRAVKINGVLLPTLSISGIQTLQNQEINDSLGKPMPMKAWEEIKFKMVVKRPHLKEISGGWDTKDKMAWSLIIVPVHASGINLMSPETAVALKLMDEDPRRWEKRFFVRRIETFDIITNPDIVDVRVEGEITDSK